VTKEVYPHQIAFNVIPQVDSFLPSGYTKEEMKMENEGRKIMHTRKISRERDLRARAGLSLAFRRRQRGI
jgi:aspartate-semialdehyde dehydrogenase